MEVLRMELSAGVPALQRVVLAQTQVAALMASLLHQLVVAFRAEPEWHVLHAPTAFSGPRGKGHHGLLGLKILRSSVYNW